MTTLEIKYNQMLDGLKLIFDHQNSYLPETLSNKRLLLMKIEACRVFNEAGVIDDTKYLDTIDSLVSDYMNNFLYYFDLKPRKRFSYIQMMQDIAIFLSANVLDGDVAKFEVYLDAHDTPPDEDNFGEFGFNTLSDYLVREYWDLPYPTEVPLT